ncbi:MAG: tandem-95 repeat protein, partial [Polaromonas sp.]|nr:tandem-95 repeat protein [Polaromonas sp.]
MTGSLLASAADIDSAELSASLVAGPVHGSVTVNTDGTFSYNASPDYFGEDSFTYRVSDGELDSQIATVSLSITAVNDAPVAADVAVTTLEDTAATISLVASDVDNMAAELQFSIQSQPAHGTLTRNADGSYSYTPTANFNGADSFTYAVTDGELVSNVATVRIEVTAVNDAPTLGNQNLTVAEDSTLTGSLLATAADIEGSPLTARIIAGPVHGSLSINADGSFSYQGSKDYFGSDSFTYRVNDGEFDSAIATVSLTVTAVNDAPVAADVTATTQEDTATTINLIASDVDNMAAELQFSVLTPPANGTLTRNTDGSYSYTPVANFNGADSFTYSVTDGALVSNLATVRIEVTAVNDAPTLGNQNLTVAEDSALTGNLFATAADVDSSTLTARVIAGPVHGSLTVNANGSFSYSASPDYFGEDSFTYKVNDGELDSQVATVSLTVTAVNDAPVAADVAVTTLEDTAATINLVASDVDNTAAELQFSIQSQPAHGTLTKNQDGSYSYTPAANFNGADSFTYSVSDGDLLSNLATVRIEVTAVNDAPTLGNQSLTVAEDNALTGNLLATAADVDSSALSARIIAGPVHGSLTVNADGSFSYQGSKDYFGSDSFTYR